MAYAADSLSTVPVTVMFGFACIARILHVDMHVMMTHRHDAHNDMYGRVSARVRVTICACARPVSLLLCGALCRFFVTVCIR